jgi:4-diphosphocytidyl-2-C-methyl-D-erythritol kinase
MPDQIRLLAPAKINWSLEITGKRADGYHQIRSIIQNVDLYDQITLAWSDHDECQCLPPVDCPAKDNLAMRAWLALKNQYALDNYLRIKIEKEIPFGRGLGGGSADAAAVLLGVNMMAGLNLSLVKLSELAFCLGADIPFCLLGGLALVEGAGETVKPYLPRVEYRLILADPGVFLSTREVYRRFDEMEHHPGPDTERLLAALLNKDIAAMAVSMGNMLEPPAHDLCSGLDEIKSIFATRGYPVWLSGSGSCLFALSGDEKKEAEILACLRNRGIKVRVVHTLSHGIEVIE